MKILVCPDKFKGSLGASQVCQVIGDGIGRASPKIEVMTHPLADGGDGMLEVLAENLGLDLVRVQVKGPLFEPVQARYGISRSGDTAYVEMSQASGLVLLTDAERNCMETTTYGTGELILDAIQRGVRHIVMGMGGSATNDAGLGVAAALGFRFLDASGHQLEPVGKSLSLVASIDDRFVIPEAKRLQVDLASDVQNPFYGKDGAAWTFARQKGADDATIALLDDGLKNVANLVKEKWGKDIQNIPGSGAAGGLGGGCIAFLDANLQSGIEMIMDITRLEDKMLEADFVVTGEGKLDEQTLGGKVINGVIDLARKHGKRVAVLCGSCTLSDNEVREAGIFYHDQIMKGGRTLDDAMANGARYLGDCAYHLAIALQASVQE